MEEIKNYKCPCCGASLSYDGSSDKLKCFSCDNEFELNFLKDAEEAERTAEIGSKYDWDAYEPRVFDGENVDFSSFTCPSCGAGVTGDSTMGATICPYCGNATIIKQQFEGALQPDYIIPFKIDKKSAIKKFEEACLKAPFLPDEFKDKKKIDEMVGVYVPFWTFDCNCEGNASYSATTTRVWSSGDYIYRKTSFYTLFREGNMEFANVPVDASKKVDNAYSEALEPFDYADAVNFDPAYLSGYLADTYDVSSEEGAERANERIKQSVERALRDTTRQYNNVLSTSSNVLFSNGKIRYTLLPVWMLNVKYQGQMYHYEINGQTGKTVGKYPVCKSKRNRFFAKVFGISFAIMALLGAVYLGFFA